MKRFLFKTFYLLLITSSLYLFFAIAPISMPSERAAIINKYLYAKSVETPKIIFIGGSGLYVGIDSDEISEKLGYEVSNLGLWAGFGIRFHLELVKEFVNPGDIVVLTPEYSGFSDNRIQDIADASREWLYVLSPHKYFSEFPFQLKLWIKDISRIVQLRLRGLMLNVISLNFEGIFENGMNGYHKEFTKRGDALEDPFPKLPKEKMESFYSDYESLYLSAASLVNLKEYENTLSNNGVRFLITYPALPKEVFQRLQEKIDALHTSLLNEELFVVGSPEQFSFSSDLFTNTVNHLSEEGKKIRTNLLIESLSEINIR